MSNTRQIVWRLYALVKSNVWYNALCIKTMFNALYFTRSLTMNQTVLFGNTKTFETRIETRTKSNPIFVIVRISYYTIIQLYHKCNRLEMMNSQKKNIILWSIRLCEKRIWERSARKVLLHNTQYAVGWLRSMSGNIAEIYGGQKLTASVII